MKRVLVINILLILIIIYLPSEKTPMIEAKEEKSVVAKTEITEDVSSRSLNEHREIKEEPIYVTTYSEELVEYIKRPNVEGFKSKAYICKEDNDNKGWYTIGYGHHDSKIKSTDTITEEEADRLLRAELSGNCELVLKHCEYLGGLTQGELNALTDFTFNGGAGMLQQLTANGTRTKEEILEHITAYTNHGVKGLVNRRNAEYQMFIGGSY